MLSWTVIVDVVVITALAPGDVERFAGAHPPHYRGSPLTRPRTAMPFDRHLASRLFAPQRSKADKWCKFRPFFTPFVQFDEFGVKSGAFSHQILDSADTSRDTIHIAQASGVGTQDAN